MGHNAIREKSPNSSKVMVYAILIFQIVLIGSLIRGIQLSGRSGERVDLLQEKKRQLEEENAKLKEDIAYVQSDYYIEKVAREELQKAKPGEQVVILPDNRTEYIVPSDQGENEEKRQLANWEKWWILLVE